MTIFPRNGPAKSICTRCHGRVDHTQNVVVQNLVLVSQLDMKHMYELTSQDLCPGQATKSELLVMAFIRVTPG